MRELPPTRNPKNKLGEISVPGCKSWKGLKHVECPDEPGRCVRDYSECEKSSAFCGTAEDGGEATKWRCSSGLCVDRDFVCDGVPHCDDASDEAVGCDLHRADTGCPSWNGRLHRKCQSANESSEICTLPQFEFESCRRCEKEGEWRCDNGFCIDMAKVGDGLVDCQDGSDEELISMKWWVLLIFTLVLAVTGVITSFLYRFIKEQV